MSNIVIGFPSGEIFNCQDKDKHDLFVVGFARRMNWFQDEEINEYVFKDELKEDVYKLIKSNIRLGLEIQHTDNGNGKIAGILGDGWIIEFNNKKNYVDTHMLLKNIKYSFK